MSSEVIQNIPRTDALKLIRENLNYTPQSEMIPLEYACDRVAADNILSKINLPDVVCSRWDGISFNYNAYITGGKDVSQWEEGVNYKFTNTGIGIDNDLFDTMVKIEDTTFHETQLVSINQQGVTRGQNTIPIGERMKIGEILIQKDTRLTPSHLNLIASGGNRAVPVYRKPIIGVITTGNELIPCTSTPDKGKTIESNSYSMRAKIEKWGGRALIFPILKDEKDIIAAHLVEASEMCDLIVIGGGSGRGQHDLLQETIMQSGRLFFSSVEHGPGKRTCFGVINKTPIIGLVGPPGGEEMTFDFYVLPALSSLLNQNFHETIVCAELDQEIPPHPKVDFYYTVALKRESDGTLHARTLPHSNIDRSIAEHNGYLFVPKKSAGYQKHQTVLIELRAGYENF